MRGNDLPGAAEPGGGKAQVGFVAISAENREKELASMKEDFTMLGINYYLMQVQAGSGQLQVM